MWRKLAAADSLGAFREASGSSSRRLPAICSSPASSSSSPRPLPVKSRSKSMKAKMMPPASSESTYFPFSPARPRPVRFPDPSSHHAISPSHLPIFSHRSISPFLLHGTLPMIERPASVLGRPSSALARGMATTTSDFASLNEEEEAFKAEAVAEAEAKKPRKRRTAAEGSEEVPVKSSKKATTKSKAPEKSVLNPPKPPPSKWQMYFADFLTSTKSANPEGKVNITAIAKAAAAGYKKITIEEHEVLNKRVKQAKDAYRRELTHWQKNLTPEDVKIENAYRAAQRKAGQSRKHNMKDPNAPKKPMSAYFSYLAAIRNDPEMIKEIFGDETETTRQSQLAAAKWRSLTEEEKAPYFREAERQKAEYDVKLAEYESQFTTIVTRRSATKVPAGAAKDSRSDSGTENES